MPRGKAPDSTRRKKYTTEDMHRAILAVRSGESVAGAARQFGVPRVTLLDKLAGRTAECCKMGRRPVVGEDEELILVRWILDCRSAGFPISTDQLIHSTQKMMEKLGKLDVFQNGTPTKRWVEGFLKRHPQLSLRECQNLTTSRASVTLENVHNWFKEVKTYLENNALLWILNDSSRVFNCDESAFFLCPDKGKVIVGRGDKAVYRVSGNSDKDNVTVLLNCAADGRLAPSMVVFPYDRWPPKVIASIPDEWGAGKTESGWMTAQSFYEYIGNVFEPYLTKKNIERPVILFMDGHSSHMSLEVSELCSEKNIILVALYPNATHILQPLDVAVFHPLKAAWRRAVTKWRFDNGGRKLKNEEFTPLLKEVLDSGAIKPETIQNGFKTCGLLSLDAKEANLTKLLGQTTATKTSSSNILTLQRHLYFLESRIEPEVLTSFSNRENVSVEDKSLFKLWNGIKTEIANLKIQSRPGETVETTQPETSQQPTQPETTEELSGLILLDNCNDPALLEEYPPNEDQPELIFDGEPIVVTVPPDPDQTFSSMSFELDISLNDSTLREASETLMTLDIPSVSWDTPIWTSTTEMLENKTTSSPLSKEIPVAETSSPLSKEIPVAETSSPLSKEIPVAETSSPLSKEIPVAETSSPLSKEIPVAETSSPLSKDIPVAETSSPLSKEIPVAETSSPLSKDIPVAETSSPLSKEIPVAETSSPSITSTPYRNIPNEDLKTTQKASDPKIPSPFKDCLMWPNPKSKSEGSKRKKVVTPSVVTSKLWKDYHKTIKEEKTTKELEMAERKKIREEKMKIKQEKTECKVKRKLQGSFVKSSKKTKHDDDDDEETGEVEDSETDENVNNFDLEKCSDKPKIPDTFKIGMWVVVPYSQKKGGCKKFVGQILSLDDENVEVKFLVEKGGKFVWPNNDDIDTVPIQDIVTILEEPIFDRWGYLTFSYN